MKSSASKIKLDSYGNLFGKSELPTLQRVVDDTEQVVESTLLSNLVDNAIEACEKVEPERRYINLIIKVVEENMFIHIENSKISAPVDINVSTKDNPDSHGIGVSRVKEIFDKYDGKVKFEQEEDRFVVKGFLNCKSWYQGIA